MAQKEIILDIFGMACLSFAVFAMANSLLIGRPSWILYFCYICTFIIGLACLKRNKNLLLSQLYVLTVPIIIWQIDFYYQLLSGNSLWGLTDYFFHWQLSLASQITALGHLIFVPLAWLVFIIMPGRIKNAAIISFGQIIILYFLVRFFTVYQENVNCVFYSCFPLVPDGRWYPISWLAINSGFIAIAVILRRILQAVKVV